MTTIDQVTSIPDNAGKREMAIIRLGKLALVAIIVFAAAIAFFAMQDWVDFELFQTNGTDIKAVTGIGDGYFVVLLAAVMILAAGAVLIRPQLTLVALPVIGAASVTAFVVAGYTLTTEWKAAGGDGTGAFILEGNPTVAPYAICGLAAATGIIAASLATFRAAYSRKSLTSPESETTLKQLEDAS
jgi:hypothetical protein